MTPGLDALHVSSYFITQTDTTCNELYLWFFLSVDKDKDRGSDVPLKKPQDHDKMCIVKDLSHTSYLCKLELSSGFYVDLLFHLHSILLMFILSY